MTKVNFALLSCPHSPEQIVQGRPFLKWLPKQWLPELMGLLRVSHKGVIQVSKYTGCLMSFPLMAGQTGQARKKVLEATTKIKTTGAGVVGLESGLRSLTPVFAQLGLAVSQGATLQVASAMTLLTNISGGIQDARVLIINAAAQPGPVCARLLAPKVRHLTLMGNFTAPLQRMAKRLIWETGTAPIITAYNPSLLGLADIIIDLTPYPSQTFPASETAVIWQPIIVTPYQGPGTLINEVLLRLDTNLQVEGDLPAGTLRASTAEAIIQGLGVERIWPRSIKEVTVDQVKRVSDLANRIDLPIIGYVNGDKISLLPNAIEI